MKNNVLFLFVLFTLVLLNSMNSNAQSVKSISVDLILSSTEETHKTGSVSPTLIIRNMGSTEVQIAHPKNRMAVAFIVLNSLGNVLSPVGLAKVDPPFREITIKPNSEVKQSFPNLEFLTGSALFGYELKSGETYRVIAIYRIDKKNSAGITTNEQIITIR